MGTEWVLKMARTPKGEVSIENIDGWIRLRWRHQGQRKTMSLGLRHDPVNLAVVGEPSARIGGVVACAAQVEAAHAL